MERCKFLSGEEKGKKMLANFTWPSTWQISNMTNIQAKQITHVN